MSKWRATSARRPGRSSSAEPVVAVPELEILARVPANVLQLLFFHLADGLGGHAHDQPARGNDLALGHEGARADLCAFLHHRAREHYRPDADPHVVHDGAGVHHATVAD